MTVLALDLSSKTGWAYGDTATANLPAFGEWRMPTGGLPGRFHGLRNCLIEFLEKHPVGTVVIEAPLPLAAMNNVAAAHQQLGMRAIVMAEALGVAATISEIDCWTVRSEVMGLRRCSRDIAKKEAVRFCLRRGIKVPGDDAADAVLIWLWHRGRMQRGRPYDGPLFENLNFV